MIQNENQFSNQFLFDCYVCSLLEYDAFSQWEKITCGGKVCFERSKENVVVKLLLSTSDNPNDTNIANKPLVGNGDNQRDQIADGNNDADQNVRNEDGDANDKEQNHNEGDNAKKADQNNNGNNDEETNNGKSGKEETYPIGLLSKSTAEKLLPYLKAGHKDIFYGRIISVVNDKPIDNRIMLAVYVEKKS